MATSKTAYEPLLQGATMHGNECCQHKSECEGQRWKHSVSLYHISVANLALLGLHFILLVGFFAKGMNTHKEEFFQRAYGSNEKYMTLDHSYDFLWADPATQKAGVIAVSRDDQGEVNEIGAISMFHQLHCLTALRTALQRAYEGEKVAFDFNEDKHWPHCLYYLRQMVTCQADGQIEGQRLWNGSSPFIDGAGDMRQCRDNSPLYELFDKERVS